MEDEESPRENPLLVRQLAAVALVVPVLTVITGLTLLADEEVFPTLAMPGFYVSGDAEERSSFDRRELVVLRPNAEQSVLPPDFLGDSMSQSFAAPLFATLDDRASSPAVRRWFLERMGEIDATSCGYELAYRRSRFELSAEGELTKQVTEIDLNLGVIPC